MSNALLPMDTHRHHHCPLNNTIPQRGDIFDDIEVFYNRARRHSHLGGVSPEAFEQASS
nr:hypothetical protein [Raoultella terrigena]